ncbi:MULTISPECIES: DUF2505 domain-containing protein [unclassified Mycobacterium]|uniref:DUF2505 domain-containing protein n=1 Tax=unclassified Mycobacterium TaxID=2642494 RepID=UPI0029C64977|nr:MULTISPECIES: DUF2505 domain-containing protein [unclassified Mycobacterium]
MSRSYDFSVECPVTLEQLHLAFSEEKYWLARLAEVGGIGKLDSFGIGTDGAVHLVVVQDLRHDALPPLFARLYPRDLEIVQNATWSLIGDDLVRGEAKIVARGAIGSAKLGTALLAPAQNRSRLNCTATVNVKVPLIGGKLESLLGRQTVEETPAMLRFTAKWISENA